MNPLASLSSRRAIGACALVLALAVGVSAQAEPTDVEVRVLARGAKFIGGYTASALVTLTDAETGEVLAKGMTQGSTGDTQRILQGRAPLSTPDSGVFKATLDLTDARRVTATVTGPMSQPQAATTVASSQWILPGRHVTAGDGWLLELPGLIVDLATPTAYQWVKANSTIPLEASVTLMCGCGLSTDGPWKADGTDVEAYLWIDGKKQKPQTLRFNAATSRYETQLATQGPGIYEVQIRAWTGTTNNAGVARTTFFVK
jgi:hypothetical protein